MFFFDTYAIIEIIKGNPNYKVYSNEPFITTRLNVMELYYYLIRVKDEATAEKYFNLFIPACIPIGNDTLKNAMKLRFKLRKENNLISYIDCVGYSAALEKGVRFLSGEKHFLGLKNVEFVQ